jgi:hypothetical protein
MPVNMMDPAYHAQSGTEHGEQVALFVWAQAERCHDDRLRFMYAIPNGGDRDKRSAANMVAEGVKAGAPDICLPIPIFIGTSGFIKYPSLYIEMKRVNGIDSDVKDKQKLWLRGLATMGHATQVAWGWLHAVEIINDYLAGKTITLKLTRK